jgi:hypothetical protein
MANMTSQTGEPGHERVNPQEGGAGPSPLERAAAGASTVSKQQLRKARASVDEEISSQRERVTGRVRTLSRALKGAGEMLEDDDLVAQCLHFASDKVAGAASYVEELEPARAADDLRELARERPAWFFGGAFALGLAIGRFARSSAEAVPSGAGGRSPRPSTRVASPNTRGVPGRTATSNAQTSGPASGGATRTGALRP